MKIPRHLWVAASAWGSRIIVAVVQLLVIRVITRRLGADQYGAFAMLYALSGWFAIADGGLGTSLQNTISERRANDRSYHELLRRGVGLVLGAALIELLALCLSSHWAGTALLRNFHFATDPDKARLFLTASALLLLGGIGQVAYKAWYAEQRGTLPNILLAAGQLIGLAAVYAVVWRSGGSLKSILLAYLLPSAAIGVLSLLKLLTRLENPVESRASVCGAASQAAASRLVSTLGFRAAVLKRAAGFGAFAIASLLVLQVDFPVISQFLQPRQIAAYGVISRVFAFAFTIYSSALLAVWPVCAEHVAVDNYGPVKGYLRTYVMSGWAFVAVFTAFITAKAHLITSILAPDANLEIPLGVIVGFGLLYQVRVWTDTYAMVLQSGNRLLPLWIGTPVQAVFSVGLQILLVPRLGLLGAVVGLICSFVLTSSWILPYCFHRSINRKETYLSEEIVFDEALSLHSNV